MGASSKRKAGKRTELRHGRAARARTERTAADGDHRVPVELSGNLISRDSSARLGDSDIALIVELNIDACRTAGVRVGLTSRTHGGVVITVPVVVLVVNVGKVRGGLVNLDGRRRSLLVFGGKFLCPGDGLLKLHLKVFKRDLTGLGLNLGLLLSCARINAHRLGDCRGRNHVQHQARNK